MQGEDRYVIRATGNPDRWCVWDTHRDAAVYGAKDLTELQARQMAQRLNEASGPHNHSLSTQRRDGLAN